MYSKRNENGSYEIRTNRDPNNQFVEPGMEGNTQEKKTKYGDMGAESRPVHVPSSQSWSQTDIAEKMVRGSNQETFWKGVQYGKEF